jgi:integrase
MPRKDFALSPAQRADARAALALLDGTGISLEESARRAVQGKRALLRIKFSAAVDQFIRSRLSDGKRARTVEWYEQKLRVADTRFGEVLFDEIPRADFHAWIKSLQCSEGTRAGIVRACRAVWNWGIGHEPQLVALDITTGLSGIGPSNAGEAEFLTVAECRSIIAQAGPYQPALALLLFAGIRPEEIAGRAKDPLLWKQIDTVGRTIRIPANISKTAKPRVIEGLPDAVWRFLQPQNEDVPISPGRTRQALERAQAAISRREWPHDATRHTFATYALALTSDPGKVATWLGHEGSPTMLHRHYRGLTTKAEAEKFWAISP